MKMKSTFTNITSEWFVAPNAEKLVACSAPLNGTQMEKTDPPAIY
jgi:hypothetical protein